CDAIRPTQGWGSPSRSTPLPARPPAMFSDRTPEGLIVRAPAKLNLFLEVHGKRPDGYHDLSTLMVAVSLFDTLVLKEGPDQDIRLDLAPAEEHPAEERPPLSAGPDNLVWRRPRRPKPREGPPRGAPPPPTHRRPPPAGPPPGPPAPAARRCPHPPPSRPGAA